MDLEQSYKELIDEMPDLVCRYLPDGTLLYVNKAYAAYHLKAADELVGTNLLDLVPDEVRPILVAELAKMHQLTPENPVQVNEHWSGDGIGRVRWHEWIDKATFDADGTIVEFLSSGRDMTERREAENRMALSARYDDLTGLANRRAIIDELERAVTRAKAVGRSLGILFVDLDGFKRINDELGHTAGDLFLATVGATLAQSVRSGDLVGRIGGDEFVVVCTDVGTIEQLEGAGDRLRGRLGTLSPPCRASIGAAMLQPGDDGAALLQRADVAMYQDKARRRSASAYLG
jgi:diguanylate cyclase (GGDEF)-like protein/PAS domain S-box-containing protein